MVLRRVNHDVAPRDERMPVIALAPKRGEVPFSLSAGR
mgnify:CR=1 FL=1|jgi:hypothetical protein